MAYLKDELDSVSPIRGGSLIFRNRPFQPKVTEEWWLDRLTEVYQLLSLMHKDQKLSSLALSHYVNQLREVTRTPVVTEEFLAEILTKYRVPNAPSMDSQPTMASPTTEGLSDAEQGNIAQLIPPSSLLDQVDIPSGPAEQDLECVHEPIMRSTEGDGWRLNLETNRPRMHTKCRLCDVWMWFELTPVPAVDQTPLTSVKQESSPSVLVRERAEFISSVVNSDDGAWRDTEIKDGDAVVTCPTCQGARRVINAFSDGPGDHECATCRGLGFIRSY